MAKFAQETFQFMMNATTLYGKKDIQFFLNAGPMENTTIAGTQSAIKMANAAGLKATFVDMQTACVDANLQQPDNTDHCDGCAGVRRLLLCLSSRYSCCLSVISHFMASVALSYCVFFQHPGIQGHRGMYEAAWPVIAKTMGWKSWPQ